MEEIYAFLAGIGVGIVVLFVVLLMMGVSNADPDSW